jgi:hypothetical protein
MTQKAKNTRWTMRASQADRAQIKRLARSLGIGTTESAAVRYAIRALLASNNAPKIAGATR